MEDDSFTNFVSGSFWLGLGAGTETPKYAEMASTACGIESWKSSYTSTNGSISAAAKKLRQLASSAAMLATNFSLALAIVKKAALFC